MAFINMKAPNGKTARVAECYKSNMLKVGYTEIKSVAPQKPVKEEPEQDSTDETLTLYDISKPIGQWSKEELAAYVKDHDIDTEGITNVKEVRAVVKKHLED